MDLTYHSWCLASVALKNVSLVRGLGQYTLRVSIELTTNAFPGKNYSLASVRAKLSVARGVGEPAYMGIASPEMPFLIRFEHRYPELRMYELGLSPRQMHELEEVRNGGDLTLRIDLQGIGDDGVQPLPVVGNLSAVVPQSEWVKQLRESGFTNAMIFEIPDVGSASRPTVQKHLDAAKEQIAGGHFENAIAACRKAFEALDGLVNDREDRVAGLDLLKSNPRGMSAPQRAAAVRAALTHFTQLSHHADKPELQHEYSRADAIWALTMTIATAQHLLAD